MEDQGCKTLLYNLKSEKYRFQYAEHFLEAFTKSCGINLILKIYGVRQDLHVSLETIFKALGIALDKATQIDTRRKEISSTKGIID